MQERFTTYVTKRGLITPEDRILLGVSGGRDSMVMLELFRRTFPAERFAVAHCNFGLRDEESDGDQTLVEKACEKHGLTLHIRRFETEDSARDNNESIQMAARRLRYDWFKELSAQEGYTKIAIAHQADDSVETFFINLMRGTGLRGLTGISDMRGKVIRPLLFASRDEVTAFAAQEGIAYRDDSTNDTLKYLRNRLRHEIIPKFSTSSNHFLATMEENLSRLQETQGFIDERISELRGRAFSKDEQGRPILDLNQLPDGSLKFCLYELLYPYGFPPEVIDDMTQVIRYGETRSGKQFLGDSWTAVLDRERLILSERELMPFQEERIDQDDPRIEWLTLDELPHSLETPPNIAYLAADALKFPLHLRKWQEGDWFIPLGMHGQKKVSDYLIDTKVSVADKTMQGVLLTGETIVWLVGRRIDDRYKVVQTAKRIIRITL